MVLEEQAWAFRAKAAQPCVYIIPVARGGAQDVRNFRILRGGKSGYIHENAGRNSTALHPVYAALLWSEGVPSLLQLPVERVASAQPVELLVSKMQRIQTDLKLAVILNYSTQIVTRASPKLHTSFYQVSTTSSQFLLFRWLIPHWTNIGGPILPWILCAHGPVAEAL